MSSLCLKQILITNEMRKSIKRITRRKDISLIDYTRDAMEIFFELRKKQDIGWYKYEKLPTKTIFIPFWFESNHLCKLKKLSIRDRVSENEIIYTVLYKVTEEDSRIDQKKHFISA